MDASNKVPAATLRYRFRFLGQRWRFLKRPLELENPATFPKLNIAIREPSVEQMMNESMISLQESSHQDRQRSTIGIAETKETSNITVDIPINNLQDMLNGIAWVWMENDLPSLRFRLRSLPKGRWSQISSVYGYSISCLEVAISLFDLITSHDPAIYGIEPHHVILNNPSRVPHHFDNN